MNCPRCDAEELPDREFYARLEWHCGSTQEKATGEFEDGIQCLRSQRNRLQAFAEKVLNRMEKCVKSSDSLNFEEYRCFASDAKAALGRRE